MEKWCGDMLPEDLFEHGPVNIYGAADESKECCNNPPWAVRCNQPFWCTTAL